MLYELKEVTDATRRFVAKEMAKHVIGCKNYFRVLDVKDRERPRIVGDIYLGRLEFNMGHEYPGLYVDEIAALSKLVDKVNVEVYGHRITSERRATV